MRFLRPLLYLWALPATLLGLIFVPLAWLSGGKARFLQGAVEIEGGLAATFLKNCPYPAMAMTLGHVILGCDRQCLERTRRHEHVHVRQYERWGPFFIPAYLGCSAMLYFRGLDPYLDNPFEREAYEME